MCVLVKRCRKAILLSAPFWFFKRKVFLCKNLLNFVRMFFGLIFSEKQAKKALPESTGMNAYSGTNRSITMSRMYYWAQEFQKLYPNEFKVYFEDENFVCYYIEQNVYRLYNFAIDYGYN